jgi:uncharacterized membrane protein YGL010W
MRKIDKLLSEYGESHQNKTNKAIHWICVPLIFFSIISLLVSIPATSLQAMMGNSLFVNWATVVLLLVAVYYLSLSVWLTVGMVVFSVLCLMAAHALARLVVAPLWLSAITIFVAAWIGQFYGHKIEGKKPSFFKDLQFLLIGPAWLMHFIYKRLGIPY